MARRMESGTVLLCALLPLVYGNGADFVAPMTYYSEAIFGSMESGLKICTVQQNHMSYHTHSNAILGGA